MAEVRLKKISKFFGHNEVLDQLDLSIDNHEFLVLVGPSGCGKSTILKIIAGLEEPTGGTVVIGGQTVTELAPKDRDIAMVFQNYALYPHMNVYDNMAFGLKMREIPNEEIDRRVREAAGVLEIEGLLERRPRQLSGGQRQRVALGRAIVRDPKVFLLDEPLSNLDAKLRVQMRAEITRLHRKLRSTMIYVTHDQTEAMTMGDRIAVIKDGRIQQVGTPEEIYNRPVNMFVAGFIGMPPMNFLSLRPGVVLGIRPEHITLVEQRGGDICTEVSGSGSGDYAVAGMVEVIEYTGAERVIYLQTVYGQVVVRTDNSRPVTEGNNYTLHFTSLNVHLFEAESGSRLGEDICRQTISNLDGRILIKTAVN